MIILTAICQKSFLFGLLAVYLMSGAKGLGILAEGEIIRQFASKNYRLNLGMILHYTHLCLPVWAVLAALLWRVGTLYRTRRFVGIACLIHLQASSLLALHMMDLCCLCATYVCRGYFRLRELLDTWAHGSH